MYGGDPQNDETLSTFEAYANTGDSPTSKMLYGESISRCSNGDEARELRRIAQTQARHLLAAEDPVELLASSAG